MFLEFLLINTTHKYHNSYGHEEPEAKWILCDLSTVIQLTSGGCHNCLLVGVITSEAFPFENMGQ